MTKNTLKALYAALTNVDFAEKETAMAELEKELNRGEAEKAAKVAEYEAAWPVIAESLRVIGKPVAVADIYNEAEKELPEGFSKNRVSYGLTHQWADRVVKSEGKVNLYSLK